MIEISLSGTVDPDDIDVYGHVNNTKYIKYINRARLELLEKLGSADVCVTES